MKELCWLFAYFFASIGGGFLLENGVCFGHIEYKKEGNQWSLIERYSLEMIWLKVT